MLLEDLLSNAIGICAYGHLNTKGDAFIICGGWPAPDMNFNCASYPDLAQELLDLAKARTGVKITPRVPADHSNSRKQHSIPTNPIYFSPTYAGFAFTFGELMLAYELTANHSAESPRGSSGLRYSNPSSRTREMKMISWFLHTATNVSQISDTIARITTLGRSPTSCYRFVRQLS